VSLSVPIINKCALQILRAVPETRGSPFLATSITNLWPSQKAQTAQTQRTVAWISSLTSAEGRRWISKLEISSTCCATMFKKLSSQIIIILEYHVRRRITLSLGEGEVILNNNSVRFFC
jgi:hypothetical protein